MNGRAVKRYGGAPPSPHSPLRVTRWAVWVLPARLLGSVLVVELLAVVLLVVDGSAGASAFSGPSVAVLAVLAVVGVAHTEIALGAERARRRTLSPHVDLSSVWTFAGRPAAAAPAGAGGGRHLSAPVRTGRAADPRPAYRWAYTTCTVVLPSTARALVGLRPREAHPSVRRGPGGHRRGAAQSYTAVKACSWSALSCSARRTDALRRARPGRRGRPGARDAGDGRVRGRDDLLVEPAARRPRAATPVVLHGPCWCGHLQEAANPDAKTGRLDAALDDRATGPEPHARVRRGRHLRPRPLQAGQRLIRPPRGGPRPLLRRRGAALRGARQRPRRRGVRDHAARPRGDGVRPHRAGVRIADPLGAGSTALRVEIATRAWSADRRRPERLLDRWRDLPTGRTRPRPEARRWPTRRRTRPSGPGCGAVRVGLPKNPAEQVSPGLSRPAPAAVDGTEPVTGLWSPGRPLGVPTPVIA